MRAAENHQTGHVQSARRAASAPSTPLTSPSLVLQLQRTVGNQAVQRLLPTGGRIQRLLANGSSLYVPPSWLDTQFDDRDETVRQVVAGETDKKLKTELLANISDISGHAVTYIEEVAAKDLGAKLQTDGFRMYTSKTKPTGSEEEVKERVKQAGIHLKTQLSDHHLIALLPGDDSMYTLVNVTQNPLDSKRLIDPKGLVKADSDLDLDTFELPKVCALIALYESEKGNLKALYEKIGYSSVPTSDRNNKQKTYEKMHTYYLGTEGIQYDEPSTHAALYKKYGYTLVFTGNTTFSDLPTKLTVTLQAGKKYIFDLDNHSVFVTMKQDLAPGVAIERPQDYFNFFSDPNNFNTGELRQRVENIYEK